MATNPRRNASFTVITDMDNSGGSNEDSSTNKTSFSFFDEFGKGIQKNIPKGVDWIGAQKELHDNEFWILVVSILLFLLWVIFLTFYASRLYGFVVGRLLNLFSRRLFGLHGRFHIGSLSISVLGGKLMVRDLVYCCEDFTVRVKDGFIVLRYWRGGCFDGGASTGSDAPIRCFVSGVEVHVYNRLENWRRICDIYGLSSLAVRLADYDGAGVPANDTPREGGSDRRRNIHLNDAVLSNDKLLSTNEEQLLKLFSKVRWTIKSGRLAFGNNMFPTTLVVSFIDCEGTCRLTKSSNEADQCRVMLKGTAEAFRVSLVKTPKYMQTGDRPAYVDPPRTMGDGFGVIQTADIDFVYQQDVVGLVRSATDDGDAPTWSASVTLGKNTVISYGPWADQQRDLLYSFFFAPDYRHNEAAAPSTVGCRRQFSHFDMQASVSSEAMLDIWFMRNNEPSSIRVTVADGSNVQLTIPWIYGEEGSTTTVNGELLGVDCTTGLVFQQFLEGDNLKFHCSMNYPLMWNDHQLWTFDFSVSKASCWFLFDHKQLIQDLILDWSSKSCPNFAHHIPYIWAFTIECHDIEVLVMLNDQNWIDTNCPNTDSANFIAAAYGRKLLATFALDFTQFLPFLTTYNFEVVGSDDLGLSIRYPEHSPMQPFLSSVYKNGCDSEISGKKDNEGFWRKVSDPKHNWLDVWRTTSAAVSLRFDYHPMPPRVVSDLPPSVKNDMKPSLIGFDPSTLDADVMDVSVEIGPSKVKLTGTIIELIVQFKDNYFGVCQEVSDVSGFEQDEAQMSFGFYDESDVARELFRPFHVQLTIRVNEIEGECILYKCNVPDSDAATTLNLPRVYLKELALEMNKTFKETLLVLALSPAIAYLDGEGELADGYLHLAGFQMRAHALFSNVDVPLDAPTVEYGWLVELTAGRLSGRLHPRQLLDVVDVIESVVYVALSQEEKRVVPKRFDFCQHQAPRHICAHTVADELCSAEHELKYRLLQLVVEQVELHIMETSADLEVIVDSVRLSTCNLHGSADSDAVRLKIDTVSLKQLVKKDVSWVVAGGVDLNDTDFEVVLPESEQNAQEQRMQFCRKHDTSSKRLHFLWTAFTNADLNCACYGHCYFYGGIDELSRTLFIGEQSGSRPMLSKNLLSLLREGSTLLHTNQGSAQLRAESPSPDDEYFDVTTTGISKATVPKKHVSATSARSADSVESHGSKVSFETAMEDTDVNIYIRHMTCPILSSSLLVSKYEQLLDSCRIRNDGSSSMGKITPFAFEGQDVEAWMQRNATHRWETSKGLNGLALHGPLKNSVSVKVNQHEATSTGLQLTGRIGNRLALLVTPLCAEGLQRLVDSAAVALIRPHAALQIQRSFIHCSLSSHKQTLVANGRKKPDELLSVNVHMALLRTDVVFLQCGVAERIVPIARLIDEQVPVAATAVLAALGPITVNASIVPDSVMTVSSSSDKSFSVQRRTTAYIGVDSGHAELLQIAELHSENIGISATASMFQQFYSNWPSMPDTLKKLYRLCLLVEAATPTISLSYSDGSEELMSQSASGGAQLVVGEVFVNFGLCRPLADRGHQHWPFYELLSPTLNAWMHSGFRLGHSLSAVDERRGVWLELSLARLLSTVVECDDDRVFVSAVMTGRAPAHRTKLHHRRLIGCASCQLLLTLLRYCAVVGIDDQFATETVTDGDEHFPTSSIRKQALIAALSHWQGALCAERCVAVYDAELAKPHLVVVRPDEQSVNKIQIEEEPALSPVNTQSPNSVQNKDTIDMESIVAEHSQASIEKEEALVVNESHTSTLVKEEQQPPQDLYHWMQEMRTKDQDVGKTAPVTRGGPKQVGTSVRDGASEEHEVNQMEIDLRVFFAPLFDDYSLTKPDGFGRAATTLLRDASTTIALSVIFKGIRTEVLEPRLLSIATQGTKRVGHKYHHLLKLDQCTVQAELGVVQEGENSDTTDPAGGTWTDKTNRLELQYEGYCSSVAWSLGFPAVTLINQLAFAVKSCLDVCDALAADDTTVATTVRASRHHDSATTASGGCDWAPALRNKLHDYQRSKHRCITRLPPPIDFVTKGELNVGQVVIDGIWTDLFVSISLEGIECEHALLALHKTMGNSKRRVEVDTSLKIDIRRAMLFLSESAEGVRDRTIFHTSIQTSTIEFQNAVNGGLHHKVLVAIGPVAGEIPMHAGFIHEVVVRHGPELNKQFSLLNVPMSMVEEEIQEVKSKMTEETPTVGRLASASSAAAYQIDTASPFDYELELSSLEVNAALLPSLRATYRMEGTRCSGCSGADARFNVIVPQHSLTFSGATLNTEPSTAPSDDQFGSATDTSSSFRLDLPTISANGCSITPKTPRGADTRLNDGGSTNADDPQPDSGGHDLVYREGGYMNIDVLVGRFELTMTTAMLNQLLFVGKAFQTELGEIVSRVTSERPKIVLPSSGTTFLFSLHVRGECSPWFQVTATTPTSTAARLIIDQLSGQLTNRWVQKRSATKERFFGQLQLQLSFVLGQLIKTAMFEEVEQELEQVAYFVTQISMQNLQSVDALSYNYVVQVHRPIIFIQPTAFDKAILLWLNYKNTYDCWNEQREKMAERKSNRQKMRKPFSRASSQTRPPPSTSDLVMRLTLSVQNGLHVCMPLYGGSSYYGDAGSAALHVSLDKTEINVCIQKDLVCRGSFDSFRVRFSEDFDVSPDNWIPSDDDSVSDGNFLYFPNGTYDVCSSTSSVDVETNAGVTGLWDLSVRWRMTGMQLDVNTKIGKMFSLLISTLTSLATEEDLPTSRAMSQVVDSDVDTDRGELEEFSEMKELNSIPAGLSRTRWIERKMHEQSVLVSDLSQLNASEPTLESERRKLKTLEAALFKQFRLEMIDKLRKQGKKATNIRERFRLAQPNPSAEQTPKTLMKRPVDATALPRVQPRRLKDMHGERMLSTIIDRSLESDEDDSCSSSSEYNRPAKAPARVTAARTAVLEGGGLSSSRTSFNEPSSSSVNMIINVLVLIDAGTCRLRTPRKEGDQGNPNGSIKKVASTRELKSKLKHATFHEPEKCETTLMIPSVSVGANYNSHGNMEIGQNASFDRLSKKGSFCLEVDLSSTPSETIVTPHLMDYLEQVAQPIESGPNITAGSSIEVAASPNKPVDLNESTTDALVMAAVYSPTFPVDVVVKLNVQSSTIRFVNKQQTGFVADCMLKLPQLTVLASTCRSDGGKVDDSGGVNITARLSDFYLRVYSPFNEGAGNTSKNALVMQVDSLLASATRSRNQSVELEDRTKNRVKFSISMHVCNPHFQYDMRRLYELIGFPKAWYRKALVRRLFFGEEHVKQQEMSESDKMSSSTTGGQRPRSKTPVVATDTNNAGSADTAKRMPAWDALLLLHISFEKLFIEAHMANTMGNCVWTTPNVMLKTSLRLDSFGNRDASIRFHWDSTVFDASGGVISARLSIDDLLVAAAHKKVVAKPPQNYLRGSYKSLYVRIDWMSRTIFLGRSTLLNGIFEDEWMTSRDETDGSVVRAAVFSNLRLNWDCLEMMLCASTATDFGKIYNKLRNFFQEQIKSSRIVWNVQEPTPRRLSGGLVLDEDASGTTPLAGGGPVGHFHRHWHQCLEMVTEIQMLVGGFFPLPLHRDGVTAVGGCIEIQGNEFALTLMKGDVNADAWAIFHLRHLTVSFMPEAKYVLMQQQRGADNEPTVGVSVSQNLTLRLGSGMRRTEDEAFAVVLQVNKVKYSPLGGIENEEKVDEWFDYLIHNVLKKVYTEEQTAFWSKMSPVHSVTPLFKFPQMMAVLKTDQLQAPSVEMESIPRVDCWFAADFDDHVYLQTDFHSLFGFLPELVKMYLKTQEQQQAKSSRRVQSAAAAADETAKHAGGDVREFVCNSWQVEPNLRFIDRVKWSPPMVDQLLQRLGILDQRKTIPKWAQRGLMDPSDLLLSLVLEQVLHWASRAS